MSKYQIEVTKPRWFGKPLVRTFTFNDDGDFSGKLYINKTQHINVKVTKL